MKINCIIGSFLGCLLILMGCSAPPTPPVQENVAEEETLSMQVLSNEATNNYYRTILPYKTSPTRGLVYSRYSNMNNRYDIDTFEIALMRESQSYFNPEEVCFQEGQYLTKAFVQQLLSAKLSDAELAEELENDEDYVDIGLNPRKTDTINVDGVEVNPVYLAYLIEQNYVVQQDQETILEGVTIGLALNPYQTWQNELGYDQTLELSEEMLLEQGKEMATRLVEILRTQEGFESIPIMIGLYIVEEQSAVTPGHMIAKTLVAKDSTKIKNWEKINEKYYLLPDNEILAYDATLSSQFMTFKETITTYYPHYYGVIGVAHFMNDSLEHLELVINIDFYSAAEKLSFHQLVATLIPETFSLGYEMDIVIRASDEIYGILHRDAQNPDVTLKLTNWK